MNKLIIEIEGGTVKAIHSDIPNLISSEIIIMDRDNAKLDIEADMWCDHLEQEIQTDPKMESINI